jgi:hypothetical protein
MKRRVVLAHGALALAMASALGIMMCLGFDPWFQIIPGIIAVAIVGRYVGPLSAVGVIGIVGIFTAVFPLAVLTAMSFHNDFRLSFFEDMALKEWLLLVAPTTSAWITLHVLKRKLRE